jgi:hypothetical protein
VKRRSPHEKKAMNIATPKRWFVRRLLCFKERRRPVIVSSISEIIRKEPGVHNIPQMMPEHNGTIILRNGISFKSTVATFETV